jgi:hypothetical protein
MGLIMDENLHGILELAGVNAAMIFDGEGRLVGHRGKAIYDRALCEHVSGLLAKAVASIELQQPDWESVAARYLDGSILMRNVGTVAGKAYLLAVVADTTLNPAFAAVAIRVASNKARKAIELGQGLPPTASSSSAFTSQAGAVSPMASSSQTLGVAPHPASGSRPVPGNSGLSWSRPGGSGASSGFTAADQASSAYLSRCTKSLARFVGPMAKVYVQEAVLRISQDAPFSLAQARALVAELAGQIEDAKERAAFAKAMQAGDSPDPSKPQGSGTLTDFATRSAVLFRPGVLRKEIMPAYEAFLGAGEAHAILDLLERAKPSAAKARTGLGPNLLIQPEIDGAIAKLKSELTPVVDLRRLVKDTLVTGLVDLLCVPWERKGVPVQRTWGVPVAEYLEARSAWIADHLLRGVPAGAETTLPSGVGIRICAREDVERLRQELAAVPRPPVAVTQREYDALAAIVEAALENRVMALALWSR